MDIYRHPIAGPFLDLAQTMQHHSIQMTDKQLLRKLLIAVLIKLALLVGLWWAFFRGQNVEVSADAMAGTLQAEHSQQPETGESRHGH